MILPPILWFKLGFIKALLVINGPFIYHLTTQHHYQHPWFLFSTPGYTHTHTAMNKKIVAVLFPFDFSLFFILIIK